MEKLETEVRELESEGELSEHELDAVNGGILPFIIAGIVVIEALQVYAVAKETGYIK